MAFKDRHTDEEGRASGGWYDFRGGTRAVAIGKVAMVLDGKIAKKTLVLDGLPLTPLLVFWDPTVAISTIWNVVGLGSGRLEHLRVAVDAIGEWQKAESWIHFG